MMLSLQVLNNNRKNFNTKNRRVRHQLMENSRL
uniref:Uncharacterized protein n=1 Tax=Lepeophtheirus salmonis TaxID=72036 RepID=A0A0K2V9I7_LEPSM